MNRRLLTVAAAGAAAAFSLALPLAAAPPGTTHNGSADQPGETCSGAGNALVLYAPTKLWPPNHKYFEEIYVLATDSDPNGGNITLTSMGTHNQYDGDTEDTEKNGSGHTADDITARGEDQTKITSEDGDATVVVTETAANTVQTDWKARAERSGTIQEGREYTITATAEFDDGTCEQTHTFTVPHDMRPSRR